MNRTVGNWGERESPTSQPLSWASESRVYDWRPNYTLETAPADEVLEKELFDEENLINSGINFKNYASIDVVVKGVPDNFKPLESFDDAGLVSAVLDNVERMHYSQPTPIQKNSIPIINTNYDLMACAQTGSGKTAAFLLPIISTLVKKVTSGRLKTIRRQDARGLFRASPLFLIILPTRELAIQIFNEARRFTYKTPIRPVVIYGGSEGFIQREQMSKGSDILIATPGRLRDMLDRGNVSLAHVRHVVLDEADRMLDMGFERQIRDIMEKSNITRDESRQTLMFSATFPRPIQILARDFLKEDFCRLRIGRIGGTTSDITQNILYVEDWEKKEKLVEILLNSPASRTMIFVETKRVADSLDDFLYNQRFPTCSIHGDRTQMEREAALEAFKRGRSPILVATAVASRGLDIKDVMHVINYDLCNNIDEYVHRIGRTARAGNQGLATTFYNSRHEIVASQLAKVLAQSQQTVPGFLQRFVDPNTTFEVDTEDFLEGNQDSAQESSGGWGWDGGRGGGAAPSGPGGRPPNSYGW